MVPTGCVLSPAAAGGNSREQPHNSPSNRSYAGLHDAYRAAPREALNEPFVSGQCNKTHFMSALQFEWDERKAATNVKKHGESFEEAKADSFESSPPVRQQPRK